MKKRIRILLCAALAAAMCGCSDESGGTQNLFPEQTTESTQESTAYGELVILYTSDVHNAYLRSEQRGEQGYAALAAYRDRLEEEGKNVLLIDGGDAYHSDTDLTAPTGADMMDIMNQVGYQLAVPGEHAFDDGVETFLERAGDQAKFQYICCNFVNLTTGETVFDSYKILEFNGMKVGFVGITTPPEQEIPGYDFCTGNHGKDLYDAVQSAVDAARRDGAEYVVAVGHTGTNPADTPWTTGEIIANITGISAWLDGHSHSVAEGLIITDKDDRQVTLCAPGEKMNYIGQIVLDLDTGGVQVDLITGLTEEKASVKQFCENLTTK